MMLMKFHSMFSTAHNISIYVFQGKIIKEVLAFHFCMNYKMNFYFWNNLLLRKIILRIYKISQNAGF
jgi:hypothetical protein